MLCGHLCLTASKGTGQPLARCLVALPCCFPVLSPSVDPELSKPEGSRFSCPSPNVGLGCLGGFRGGGKAFKKLLSDVTVEDFKGVSTVIFSPQAESLRGVFANCRSNAVVRSALLFACRPVPEFLCAELPVEIT